MAVGWGWPPSSLTCNHLSAKCSCDAWSRSGTELSPTLWDGRAAHSIRTPLLCFDLDDVRGGSIAHRGEGQDTDAVGGARDEAAHGGEVAIISVVFLPHAQGQVWVSGVVHTIPSDLPVGLLWLLPLHQHGAGTQHPCLHFEGWA